MITPITATFPALNFPKEVDYPTQEDWAAFSAAAELNYGILSGEWSDKSEEFKEQTNNLALEIQAIGENAINVITFDNIAELKLNSNMNRVDVLGYYIKGDGGGGAFYWDSTSIEDDNGGTIIQATGDTTGRWKRVFSGAVNVKWFGAKSIDEVGFENYDSALAFQTAINIYDDVFVPKGNYKFINNTEYSLSSNPYINTVYAHILITGKSNKNIVIAESATITVSEEIGRYSSAFVLDNCNDIKIIGGVFATSSIKSEKILYSGAGVISCNSSKVLVEYSNFDKTKAGVVFISCSKSNISRCTHTSGILNSAGVSTVSFGLYSSSDCNIDYCDSYIGTTDGNIGIFGGASYGNTISNCKVYNFNYAIGETVDDILVNTAQGIFNDSGPRYTDIHNNYVEGFYYGIDNKNNSSVVTIESNIVVGNKFNIVSRAGETEGYTNSCIIKNNTIVLDNKNMNTDTRATSVISSIPIKYFGIFVQWITASCVIDGNSFYVRENNDLTPNILSNACFLHTESNSSIPNNSSTFLISNNNFNGYNIIGSLQSGLSGNSGIHINIADLNNSSNGFILSNNIFKFMDGAFNASNPSAIEVYRINNLTISNNAFLKYGSQSVIRVLDASNLSICNNNFIGGHSFAKLSSVTNSTVDGNMIGYTQEYGCVIYLTDSTRNSITSNIIKSKTAQYNAFIYESGVSNYNIISLNQMMGIPNVLVGANNITVNNMTS